MNETALHQLLSREHVWRARVGCPQPGMATGIAALDRLLPGGWPHGALIEILSSRRGGGEGSLLLPALARLSDQRRWLTLIAPPHIPYAPALAAAGVDISRVLMIHARRDSEILWAAEQSLSAGTCAAVLVWPGRCTFQELRRLQLAAQQTDTMAWLIREASVREQPSPATLRMVMEADIEGLRVNIVKHRGGGKGEVVLRPAMPDTVAMPTEQVPLFCEAIGS